MKRMKLNEMPVTKTLNEVKDALKAEGLKNWKVMSDYFNDKSDLHTVDLINADDYDAKDLISIDYMPVEGNKDNGNFDIRFNTLDDDNEFYTELSYHTDDIDKLIEVVKLIVDCKSNYERIIQEAAGKFDFKEIYLASYDYRMKSTYASEPELLKDMTAEICDVFYTDDIRYSGTYHQSEIEK